MCFLGGFFGWVFYCQPWLQGVPEFLLDLLPRVDLSVGSDVTRCVDLLLRISMQQRSVDSGGEVGRWV